MNGGRGADTIVRDGRRGQRPGRRRPGKGHVLPRPRRSDQRLRDEDRASGDRERDGRDRPFGRSQPLSLSLGSADRGMVKRGTGVDEADPSVEEINTTPGPRRRSFPRPSVPTLEAVERRRLQLGGWTVVLVARGLDRRCWFRRGAPRRPRRSSRPPRSGWPSCSSRSASGSMRSRKSFTFGGSGGCSSTSGVFTTRVHEPPGRRVAAPRGRQGDELRPRAACRPRDDPSQPMTSSPARAGRSCCSERPTISSPSSRTGTTRRRESGARGLRGSPAGSPRRREALLIKGPAHRSQFPGLTQGARGAERPQRAAGPLARRSSAC